MKNKLLISLVILATTASLIACQNEDKLREAIDVSPLRTLQIAQMKDIGNRTIHFKVEMPAVVMSQADNFEAGSFIVQDGDESKDGLLIKVGTAHNFTMGQRVSINLDGVKVSDDGGLCTITVPDLSYITAGASGTAYEPAVISVKQLESGYFQSMYVALEGFQAIDEALDGTMGGSVLFQNADKDTLTLYTDANASFAGSEVPSNSGMVKGVVARADGRWVLRPQQASDFDLKEERFRIKGSNSAIIVWSEGSLLERFVTEVSTNEIDGAVSIDGNGTKSANCYVVSKTGTYCFAAKDPSGKYPEGISEETTIYFKVGSLGGNAVVGYVDPDTDRICWTWHIWASETPLEAMAVKKESVGADDGKGRSITLLDRLLGAVSTKPGSPAANGLYFQWGRKDAFPGASIIGDYANDKETQSEDYIGGEATAATSVNTAFVPAWYYAEGSAETATPQGGAANPTTFITSSDWSLTPSAGVETWDAVADPCPYGYHVPSREEAQAVTGSGASIPNADMDMGNLGTVIDGVWYPNNGDRARKNGRLLSLGRRHFSWINSYNGNSGYCITVSSGAINPSGSFNRGNATGVRCVKDYTESGVVTANQAVVVWSDSDRLDTFVSEVTSAPAANAVRLPGPANCFVIDKAGTYSFDATDAKGNYPAGIPEGTVITVKASKVGGNTVVGYTDPESGRLLWTWHLWLNDKKTADMEVMSGDVTLLSRLLGAVSDKPGSVGTIGLYYQWGRKDPMAGVNMIGQGDDKEDMKNDQADDGTKGIGGPATNKGSINAEIVADWSQVAFEGTTHQEAAALPTTYLTAYTFADQVYPETDTWAEEANPCPYGYTIPTQEQATRFFGEAFFERMYHADGTTPGMDVTENLGCTFTGIGIWFPNNGNRARAEGRILSLGRRHFSWLNEKSGNNGKIVRLARKADDTSTAATFAKGNATGVRCVKVNQ